MRLRVVSLFVLSFAFGAAWACSLNPQPFPPEDYDASKSPDAALTAFPDASGGADAGVNDDGSMPGDEDASIDAASDASDASDAATDAADDARDDANDGAVLDAGDDG